MFRRLVCVVQYHLRTAAAAPCARVCNHLYQAPQTTTTAPMAVSSMQIACFASKRDRSNRQFIEKVKQHEAREKRAAQRKQQQQEIEQQQQQYLANSILEALDDIDMMTLLDNEADDQRTTTITTTTTAATTQQQQSGVEQQYQSSSDDNDDNDNSNDHDNHHDNGQYEYIEEVSLDAEQPLECEEIARPGVHVVAAPIGNLSDISLRAKHLLPTFDTYGTAQHSTAQHKINTSSTTTTTSMQSNHINRNE
jgi:hypothetical protein